MTNLIRPAAVLKAALTWACKDPTRFHLNGLCVDGASLVATDGHRLLKITGGGPGGGAPSFIVPDVALSAACKLAGAKGMIEIVAPVDGAGVLRAYADLGPLIGAIDYKPIDSKFPPYEQVIPTISEGVDPIVAHTLNPLYIAAMADVCVALDGKAYLATHGVDLRTCTGAIDPVAYTYQSRDGAVVTFVIMPIRGGAYDRAEAAN